MGLTQHQAMQVATIAGTVASRVIDFHNIPLKGAVAVEIPLPPKVITGMICSSEEHAPDVETPNARFTEQVDCDKIVSLVSNLVDSGQSFVTRTRDGSVMWTIGCPAEDPNPSEF
ncbi:MAG: hypothetical protein WC693_03740 [Patescibacteria group bacterium]|jgi:hypothetical protein